MRHITGTKEEVYAFLSEDKGRNEYVGIAVTDQKLSFDEEDYYHEFPKLKTKQASSDEFLVFDRNGNYVGVKKESDIMNADINNDTTEEENVELPQEIKNETAENNTISIQDNSINNNTIETNETTNEVAINNTIIENTIVENN